MIHALSPSELSENKIYTESELYELYELTSVIHKFNKWLTANRHALSARETQPLTNISWLTKLDFGGFSQKTIYDALEWFRKKDWQVQVAYRKSPTYLEYYVFSYVQSSQLEVPGPGPFDSLNFEINSQTDPFAPKAGGVLIPHICSCGNYQAKSTSDFIDRSCRNCGGEEDRNILGNFSEK